MNQMNQILKLEKIWIDTKFRSSDFRVKKIGFSKFGVSEFFISPVVPYRRCKI